jgi:hypothetical protein
VVLDFADTSVSINGSNVVQRRISFKLCEQRRDREVFSLNKVTLLLPHCNPQSVTCF